MTNTVKTIEVWDKVVYVRSCEHMEYEKQAQITHWTVEAKIIYSWSTGTITWKGCDIMLIDDALKPDEADSDQKIELIVDK
jgi:hypothetical protein